MKTKHKMKKIYPNMEENWRLFIHLSADYIFHSNLRPKVNRIRFECDRAGPSDWIIPAYFYSNRYFYYILWIFYSDMTKNLLNFSIISSFSNIFVSRSAQNRLKIQTKLSHYEPCFCRNTCRTWEISDPLTDTDHIISN